MTTNGDRECGLLSPKERTAEESGVRIWLTGNTAWRMPRRRNRVCGVGVFLGLSESGHVAATSVEQLAGTDQPDADTVHCFLLENPNVR